MTTTERQENPESPENPERCSHCLGEYNLPPDCGEDAHPYECGCGGSPAERAPCQACNENACTRMANPGDPTPSVNIEETYCYDNCPLDQEFQESARLTGSPSERFASAVVELIQTDPADRKAVTYRKVVMESDRMVGDLEYVLREVDGDSNQELVDDTFLVMGALKTIGRACLDRPGQVQANNSR